MSTDLKKGKRHGGSYYFPTGISNAICQSWNGSL